MIPLLVFFQPGAPFCLARCWWCHFRDSQKQRAAASAYNVASFRRLAAHLSSCTFRAPPLLQKSSRAVIWDEVISVAWTWEHYRGSHTFKGKRRLSIFQWVINNYKSKNYHFPVFGMVLRSQYFKYFCVYNWSLDIWSREKVLFNAPINIYCKYITARILLLLKMHLLF